MYENEVTVLNSKLIIFMLPTLEGKGCSHVIKVEAVLKGADPMYNS